MACSTIGMLSFLLICQPMPILSQEAGQTAVIRGQVFDKLDGEPIGNVNAFISNTTKGSSSGPDGRFTILGVPFGRSELVLSRIGYDRMVIPIELFRPETLSVVYYLTEALVEINQIDIHGTRDEKWEQALEQFKLVIFGTSAFSEECTLLNPEVLQLICQNDSLIAKSIEPLQIENRALGYHITVIFDRFGWNIRRDFGSYKMYPFFEELHPTESKELETWQENRTSAWRGSLKHFFRSLIEGNSESDLFRLYAGSVERLVQGGGHRVSRADILMDTLEGTPFVSLHLPSPLRVEYGIWEDVADFDGRSRRGYQWRSGKPQLERVSIIEIRDSTVIVDPDGNLLDPLKVVVSGAWGLSRVPEMLPLH